MQAASSLFLFHPSAFGLAQVARDDSLRLHLPLLLIGQWPIPTLGGFAWSGCCDLSALAGWGWLLLVGRFSRLSFARFFFDGFRGWQWVERDTHPLLEIQRCRNRERTHGILASPNKRRFPKNCASSFHKHLIVFFRMLAAQACQPFRLFTMLAMILIVLFVGALAESKPEALGFQVLCRCFVCNVCSRYSTVCICVFLL